MTGAKHQSVDLVFEGGGVKGIGLAGPLACSRSAASSRRTSPARPRARSRPRCSRPATGGGAARDHRHGPRLPPVPGPGLGGQAAAHRALAEPPPRPRRLRGRALPRPGCGSCLAAKGVRTFADLVRRRTSRRPALPLRPAGDRVRRHDRRLLVLPRDAGRLGIEPDELEVALAVRMSMSIPIFFEPVRHRRIPRRARARDRRRRNALELPGLAVRLRQRRAARVADVRAAARRAEAEGAGRSAAAPAGSDHEGVGARCSTT